MENFEDPTISAGAMREIAEGIKWRVRFDTVAAAGVPGSFREASAVEPMRLS